MFAIQDKETGNFLSPFSFQLIDENLWLYTTYTGLLGTRFYSNKELAEKMFEKLNSYNIESGANRKLCIVQIDYDKLSIGERKYQYFSKIMFKPIDFAV